MNDHGVRAAILPDGMTVCEPDDLAVDHGLDEDLLLASKSFSSSASVCLQGREVVVAVNFRLALAGVFLQREDFRRVVWSGGEINGLVQAVG